MNFFGGNTLSGVGTRTRRGFATFQLSITLYNRVGMVQLVVEREIDWGDVNLVEVGVVTIGIYDGGWNNSGLKYIILY